MDEEMAELMDDDVFQAFGRIKGETYVYADAPGRWLATAPTTPHVPIS